MNESAETPGLVCLKCGYEMDFADGIFGAEGLNPEPGDVSICIKCGAFSLFGDDLKLREPTAEEFAKLTADETHHARSNRARRNRAMNPRWNFSSIALVLWVGAALILPAARAVGLIHLSWWICAAPFGILFVLGSITILFAGVLNHAALSESDGEQRDVASDSQNDGAAPSETADTSAAFVSTRFVTKK